MRRAALLAGAVLGLVVLAPAAAASDASSDDAAAPEAASTRIFAFQDPEVTESSGLVDQDDTVLTINDSGGSPTVFVIDSATGETVGRTTYTHDEVVDVEAIARGPGDSIWVGDIGDNQRVRKRISIYDVGPVTPGDHTVNATRYDLVYPDRPRDAETLLVSPDIGQVYIVSKGLLDGEVFRAPETLSEDGPNELTSIGQVGGLVTDGDFLPDGEHVVLRDYADAFVYAVEPWSQVSEWTLPDQPQGEGLSVSPSGTRVLVSSEGNKQPVYSVEIPEQVVDAIGPVEASPTPAPSTAPQEADDGMDPVVMWGLAAAAVVLVVVVGIALKVRASRPRSRWTS